MNNEQIQTNEPISAHASAAAAAPQCDAVAMATIVAPTATSLNTNTVESTAEAHQQATQIADAMAESPNVQLGTVVTRQATDVVKSKQEERRDLFALVDIVRCLVEMRCASVVNQKHSMAYKGTFDMRFDNPDEVTPKTINAFLSKGVVIVFPDDINDYPLLKKYCKQDGGINLSALCTRKNRPANISDADWTSLMDMWVDISTTLHVKGIDPIYSVFTEALRSFGYGGPKINRKLGGGLAAVQGTQAPMQDVLKKLISMLEGITK